MLFLGASFAREVAVYDSGVRRPSGLAPAGFLPSEASRYLDRDRAQALAEDCVALGLAERLPGGRYRLLTRARSFGGTLEWWVGRELSTRLGVEVATGVRSGARGIGGDLDLVAAIEGSSSTSS